MGAKKNFQLCDVSAYVLMQFIPHHVLYICNNARISTFTHNFLNIMQYNYTTNIKQEELCYHLENTANNVINM